MNTFLPYSSFDKSLKDLDMKRLGKQRVEGFQILRSLTGLSNGKGWRNHPCTLMWKGNEILLAHYTIASCDIWLDRGYKDSLREQVYEILNQIPGSKEEMHEVPWWLGNEDFHKSHQSNLKRKDPIHYGHYDVEDDLPYLWPTEDRKFRIIERK